MPKNRLAVVFAAFAVFLVLLPSLAAAEPFTLPAKAVYLESWEYWAVCVEPVLCMYHNYGNAYTPDSFIVYRTLISPDGSRQILDIAPQSDNIRNYYPTYYHSLSASVPEKEIDLSEPGSYKVELRLIRMPRATALHASSLTPDSTVDWWVAEHAKPGPGTTCTVYWNDNDCWTERLAEEGVKLSDKSQLLEYYEITVAAPVTLPNNPENNIDRSSMSIVSVSSPFEQNKGVSAKSDTKAQTAGMALSGILAVGAVGAGAYLYRSYSTQSGSSFKAYQTAAGRANDAAVLAEKEKIRRMDEEYAEKMRQYNLKKQMTAFAAGQSAQPDRSAQLQKDLEKIQNSKSYADAGSSYALLASKYSDILSNDEKKQLMAASNDAWNRNATITAPTITTASFAPVVMAAPIAANTGSASKRNSFADDAAALFAKERNDYDAYKKARQNTGLLDNLMDWSQQQIDRTYGFLSAGKDFAVGTINLLGEVVVHPVETVGGIASGIGAGLGALWNDPAKAVSGLVSGLKTRYVTDDHPGIGEGRLAFDVASILVPVGGGAKVVKGAQELRGVTLAKDVIQINWKAVTAESLLSKTLNIFEKQNLNALLPNIAKNWETFETRLSKISYENMDAWAAARYDQLVLIKSNKISEVLGRESITHEFGHMAVDQLRFKNIAEWAKSFEKTYTEIDGAKWLTEHEANMMVRAKAGSEVFSKRVNVLAEEIVNIEPSAFKQSTLSKFMSIDRLSTNSGGQVEKILQSKAQELVSNGVLTQAQYNQLSKIFDTAGNKILNSGGESVLNAAQFENEVQKLRTTLGVIFG